MNSFTITEGSKAVKLDKGNASVTFTVTNSSDKAVRGTPKVNPIRTTAKEWFNLAGGSVTREFSAKETKSLVVEIKLPGTVQPGEYSFGLNISNEANPDDDCTVGPAVTFRFEGAAAPKDNKKPFPWWIFIVLGVVLVGGGVAVWLLLPSKVPVPPVVGKPLDQASNAVVAAKLRFEVSLFQATGTNPLGVVFGQEPKADEKASKNSAVKVKVERERDKVRVPDVTRKTLSWIKETFPQSPLVFEEGPKHYVPAKLNPPGTILEQNPTHSSDDVNTWVDPGKKIVLTIAAPTVQVPDVQGGRLAENDARKMIELSKLSVGQIHKTGPAQQQFWGRVLTQSPKPGEEVEPGSAVTLYVGAPGAPTPPGQPIQGRAVRLMKPQ